MYVNKIISTNYPNNQLFNINENNKNRTNFNKIKNTTDTISFSGIEKPVINTASNVFNSVLRKRNLTPRILCGGLENLSRELLRDNTLASRLKIEGKIDAIIDLRAPNECGEVGNIIRNAGLKYCHLDMRSLENWFIYVTKERPVGSKYYTQLQEFLKSIGYKDNIDMNGFAQSFSIAEHKPGLSPEGYAKLKEFLDTLGNENNVLMGCAKGEERTSLALLMNHFFNKKQPPCEATIKCYKDPKAFDRNSDLIEKIDMYLSPEQKAELGIKDRYKEYSIAACLKAMKAIGWNCHDWDIAAY